MSVNYELNLPLDGSNLGWTFVGNLMIAFTKVGGLQDSRLLELAEAANTFQASVALGLGIGRSTLTSVQRKKSAELFGGFDRMATVYDDRITRGIITALSWLGMNVSSFDWNRLRDAVEYLNPTGVEVDDVIAISEELRDKCLAIPSNP